MSARPAGLRYQRAPLYAKQTEAIFCPKRISIIEASTKSGKTHGALVWLTERTLLNGRPGQERWWVAPIFKQAEIAYKRLKRGFKQGYWSFIDYKMTAIAPNGAIILFKGADDPDSLYGEDVHDAVIDEATRTKAEVWHAIRSTLTATRGHVRIIGNVKGRVNWVYGLARKAEAGDPEMSYFKLTAYDAVEAGVLAAQEIEDAKEQLPEHVFRELYLAEPADDGGNPFGIDAIAACIAPLSAAEPIAWGWDLAKSIDYTVGTAIDSDGNVCRFDRWNKVPWGETKARIITNTGKCNAIVDSTGVGDSILEDVQRAPSLGRFEGFKFSSTSKQQLMEELATGIQQRLIRFPKGPITAELEAFEYQYTRTGVKYSAPDGMHDDCVISLALAFHLWKRRQHAKFSLSGARVFT